MRAQRSSRRTGQRSNAPASAPPALPAGYSLGQHAKALRTRPGDLSVEDLRDIGREIEVCLRSGGKEVTAEDDDDDDGGCRSRRAGLEAAALFTATCSIRSEKDQDVLLGTQDKVLVGLRALSSSLTPDLHRHFQTALLALVAQSGFTKKRKGYRQHLVQALAEAASGPVPPCTLLPMLRAKETGPSATDLVMEVLETIARSEHDSGNGSGGAKSKKGIIDLLHHVVAEVVSSGVAKRGKRATKGPPAHLIAFLVQSCSAVPECMLVFSKDLLLLVESRSSSTRKLSLAVLRAILAYGNGHQRDTHGPAIATVLRLSRLDGDVSVRSLAFDIVAEYLDQEEGYFNDIDNDSTSDPDNNTTSEPGRQQAKAATEPPSNENNPTITGVVEMEVTPCPDTATNTGDELKQTPERASPALKGEAGDVTSHKQTGEGGTIDPWAVGGVILSSLTASADALLMDGSKAVRAKALTCSLCILTAHGSDIKPDRFYDGAFEGGGAPVDSNALKKTLQEVAKGAWRALEAVATDSSGTMQACAGTTGAGRSRRAADAARDLLLLPCVNASPVDNIVCYARCKGSTGAGEGAAVATAEATRALREVARARWCADVDSLLRAVSVVMTADCDGKGGDDPTELFGDETAGGSLPEGFTNTSLSEVLCEVFAGIDGEVIVSLLHNTLEVYTQGEETGRCHGNGAKASVLLRALSLLGEASGASVNQGKQGGGNRAHDAVRILAESQHLFWQRLERLMQEVDNTESGAGGGRQCDSPRESESLIDRSDDVGSSVGDGDGAEVDGACGGFDVRDEWTEKSTADLELPELLGIFRLLASRSLLPCDNGAALEALVFPSALSRRRLIRPAIGLALALEQPRRVLLSSLAILQDASFARSSTDVARACGYVRLIGVLARENSSFIAAHMREKYGLVEEKSGQDLPREDDGDYMAGVSNRQAMETEIRRLREASVTSDGMLSCYTPFLLAIVQRRVADSAAKAPPIAEPADVPLPAGDSDDGNDDVVGTEEENTHKIVEKDEKLQGHGASADKSCPSTLCAEALWALSEYAVLSPGLASAEVLPLAAALAGDTMEYPQVRAAAVCALTRRELATDEIAAHACGLLGDENPRLRQKVLRRLGSLMKESRIKTAHLSRFALLLVDKDERVRQTAEGLFVDHLQPRPDSVCRCLFETYFTLDAAMAVKRAVLDSLIVVSQRAAPGQGLGSLGGALMRKTAETGDADAAFFLSSVPPTIGSFEVAEVALRRGQLAQAPLETVALIVTHFAKRAQRRGPAATGVGQASGRGGGGGRSGGADLLPVVQALAMAERIGSLSARRKVGRLSRGGTVEAGRESSEPTKTSHVVDDIQQGEKGDVVCTPPATSWRTRAQRRGSPKTRKEKAGRRSKKRGRPREVSSRHRGGSGSRGAKGNGNDDKSEGGDNVLEVSADGEVEKEEEEEEEEMEWEG